ncbi:hypothetical protein HCN44_006686 [Aphidius gifuensis]|uniref:Uncharacterized protein n=1 Tax=Aphidius gifuensis TaxID=684658 RepID=A0A835CT25_APHGI|nr:uncharacterized protein LOC122849989 [Aphidius gifuensis]KAF7995579.1 hypothetical protein HCN44_006686 [Aphidius gifuensis]
MKRLSIIVAIAFASIFIFDQASGGPVSKRDADKSMMDSIKDMLSGIPGIGGMLADGVQKMQDVYNKIQELTNGAFGRVLGGALPCTAYLDEGIKCSGVSTKSSWTDITRSLLDPIPPLMIPGFVKSLIYMMMDSMAAPMMDVLFGGVKKQ